VVAKTDPRSCKYIAMKRKVDAAQYAAYIFSQKEYLVDYASKYKSQNHLLLWSLYGENSFISSRSKGNLLKELNKILWEKTLCLGLENVLMNVSTMAEAEADDIVQIYIG